MLKNVCYKINAYKNISKRVPDSYGMFPSYKFYQYYQLIIEISAHVIILVISIIHKSIVYKQAVVYKQAIVYKQTLDLSNTRTIK